MFASIHEPHPSLVVESLREKILEQAHLNALRDELLPFCQKAILCFMEHKMSRREIMPMVNCISFRGISCIQNNVLHFEYSGGFFTTIIAVVPNPEEDSADIKIISVDAIPQLHPGLIAGQRWTIDNVNGYRQ